MIFFCVCQCCQTSAIFWGCFINFIGFLEDGFTARIVCFPSGCSSVYLTSFHLVILCMYMLISVGFTSCVCQRNHRHHLRHNYELDGLKIIFYASYRYFLIFGLLLWHRVQSLFWYLLGWTQYALGSLQINSFSNHRTLKGMKFDSRHWYFQAWIASYKWNLTHNFSRFIYKFSTDIKRQQETIIKNPSFYWIQHVYKKVYCLTIQQSWTNRGTQATCGPFAHSEWNA